MRAEFLERQRLAALHRLVAYVRDRGVIQVPAPIAALDGATFFEVDGNVWQLEPWMPGTADFSTYPTDVRLQASLTCLAHWHREAGRCPLPDADRAWFFNVASGRSPGLTERSREIDGWNHEARAIIRQQLGKSSWKEFAELGTAILDGFVRAGPRIAAQLKLGVASPVPLQPCLRDIWHDHVLLTGNEVTGLIDPFAARSDSVATDLARLLGTLVADDRRAWDVGLEAYQQIRPLSLCELALIELFDQTGVLLSGMTWLDWHCRQGRVFDDPEKVLTRLRTIVERLGRLA